MQGHPTFAIVGHPNKGKSSIAATLAEDDTIAISADPGTTRRARGFQMRVDDQVLYELIDTPGFQRPRAALAWLQAHERGAAARPSVVAQFADEHRDDPKFHDECELLTPILKGAGILYVVDGAHPYGQEYEAEMEILRWTGQPRMALINMIGPGDHVDEWRRALNQYFSIVRVFDAQHADHARRMELLRAFRELGEVNADWSRKLDLAAAALDRKRTERRRRAASEIGDLLIDVLSAQVSAPTPEFGDQSQLTRDLVEKLKDQVRRRELAARRFIQELYGHRHLSTAEHEMSVLAEDLFSKRSFAVFGLSSTQLGVTGATAGAIAGGAIDLALGGATLMLGAGIGAVLGGLGVVLGANQMARVQLLGTPLGGYRLTVGPISAPNVPWTIVGRAILHYRLVAERNHSRREAMVLESSGGEHFAQTIDDQLRRRLAANFKRISDRGGLTAQQRDEFIEALEQCL